MTDCPPEAIVEVEAPVEYVVEPPTEIVVEVVDDVGLSGPAGAPGTPGAASTVPGPPGPPGAPGAVSGLDGTLFYRHIQSVPSTDWVIQHNLDFDPNVTVVDGSGTVIYGSLTYEPSRVLAHFSTAFTGQAFAT